MEKPYFVMIPKRMGIMKYWLLALIPSLLVCFLIGPDTGTWMFLFLAILPVSAKNHTIVVFDDSLTEKDPRGRFVRKVSASQIVSYRRNILGEISLIDSDSKKLLCVESNMTNRDRFEQWLTAHNIESK